jgi:site-specific DNA recombinase
MSKDTKGSVSLEDQETRCRAWAAAMGWEVARVYSDIASGGSVNGRTQFLQMIEDMKARQRPFERIVALRIDRLGRSVLDIASLVNVAQRQGVAVCTVENSLDSSTPVGQMVISILGAVAGMERELIKSRTRDSLERRRTLGLRWGGQLPYGFTTAADGAHVVLDPARVPVVREIFSRRAKGESLSAIAAALNAKAEKNIAYRPATARRWNPKSPQVVSQILANAGAYRPHIAGLPVV